MSYFVVHVNKTVYQHREVVKLEFSYNEELVKLVKKLKGAFWDNSYRAWFVEKRAGLLNEVIKCFWGKAYVDYRSVKHEPLLTAPAETVDNIDTIVARSGRLNNTQRSRAKQYALFI